MGTPRSIEVHVDDGGLNGLGIDGWFLAFHGDEHGLHSDVVDQARDAAAVAKDLGDSAWLEDIFLAASGGPHVANEKLGDLVLIERSQLERTPILCQSA